MGKSDGNMELVWGQILSNFNYGKCVGKNLRLPILWENYGNKVPIHMP